MTAVRALAVSLTLTACSTAGSTWMSQAESPAAGKASSRSTAARGEPPGASADSDHWKTRVIGASAGADGSSSTEPHAGEGSVSFGSGGSRTPLAKTAKIAPGEGKVLGTFRNTYYDFPSESEFQGGAVTLKDARCESITSVPRGFFEAVCVQGSGILSNGHPVSYAKRDCDCAEICPRTGQKICFESLDPARYPWGRGARGLPITPLLTVAVDDTVVPLGTSLYVPEFDGIPTSTNGAHAHDGCFLAEDRGLRVKGQHLDLFTGSSDVTALWNRLVPSNRGVTVVLGSPKCARVEATESAQLSESPKKKANQKATKQKAQPAPQ